MSALREPDLVERAGPDVHRLRPSLAFAVDAVETAGDVAADLVEQSRAAKKPKLTASR
jgi:hypothetical protein